MHVWVKNQWSEQLRSGLAVLHKFLEPQSVAEVAGASKFVLQEAHMEFLVGTGVARQRIGRQRVGWQTWSSDIQEPLLTSVSTLDTSCVVFLIRRYD